MLEPKEITINGKKFIISKFTAIAGREIIAKYPLSGLPKIGEYKVNEETMLKLMSFVGVSVGNEVINLTTPALVDNHTKDWETLMLVEAAMLEYNCSFFQNGRVSTFLNDVVQNLPQWTIKMLTILSEQLSPPEKQV